jgi:hypothetical protein
LSRALTTSRTRVAASGWPVKGGSVTVVFCKTVIDCGHERGRGALVHEEARVAAGDGNGAAGLVEIEGLARGRTRSGESEGEAEEYEDVHGYLPR